MQFLLKDVRRLRPRKYWQLYAMISIPLALLIIFHYLPMGGVLLAFKDYSFRKGIWRSPWVGLKYFRQFLGNAMLPTLLRNTVGISLYSLAAGFPCPILFALLINECSNKKYAKLVQLTAYVPNFISMVVLCGMILQFFNANFGLVNNLLTILGLPKANILAQPAKFSSLYVWSGVWQGMGYGAILYIAALAGVDPEQVESSVIDGANRIQRILHIDIPAIAPTIIITLILSAGSLLNVGFEKVFLLQNDVNQPVSEVISTYVYKRGIIKSEYGYSTAVGMLNSVVNMILLIGVNAVAKRIGETSLW